MSTLQLSVAILEQNKHNCISKKIRVHKFDGPTDVVLRQIKNNCRYVAIILQTYKECGSHFKFPSNTD